jgi:hypothetical protein
VTTYPNKLLTFGVRAKHASYEFTTLSGTTIASSTLRILVGSKTLLSSKCKRKDASSFYHATSQCESTNTNTSRNSMGCEVRRPTLLLSEEWNGLEVHFTRWSAPTIERRATAVARATAVRNYKGYIRRSPARVAYISLSRVY